MEQLPSAPKEWVPRPRNNSDTSQPPGAQDRPTGPAPDSVARNMPAGTAHSDQAQDETASQTGENQQADERANSPGRLDNTRPVEGIGRPQSAASWHGSERMLNYGRTSSVPAAPVDFSLLSGQYPFEEGFINMPPKHSSRAGTPSSSAHARNASRAPSDGRVAPPSRPPSARSTASSATRGGLIPPSGPFLARKEHAMRGQDSNSMRAPPPPKSRSNSFAEPAAIDPRSLDSRAVDSRARGPDLHAVDPGVLQPNSSNAHADDEALDPGTFGARWAAARSKFEEFLPVMDQRTLQLGFYALKRMSEPESPSAFATAENEVWTYIRNISIQVSRRSMDDLQLQVQHQLLQRQAQQFVPQHAPVFGHSQNAPSVEQLSYGQLGFQQQSQQFEHAQQYPGVDMAGVFADYAMPPALEDEGFMEVKAPSASSRKTGTATARGPRQQGRDAKLATRSEEDDGAKTARRTHGKKANDAAYKVPPPFPVPDVPTPTSTRPIEVPVAPPPKETKEAPKRRSVRVRGWSRQPQHLVAAAREVFRELCEKLAPTASAMGVTVPALLNNLQGSNASPAARWNLFQQFFRLSDDYTPRRQFDDLFAEYPSTTAYDKLRAEIGDEKFDELMQEFAVTFPNGTDRASELDSQEIFDAVVSQLEDTAAVYSAFYKIEIFCLLAGADINIHGKDMAAAIMTKRSSGFQRRSRLAVDSLLGQYRTHLFHAVAEEQMAELFADEEQVVPKADLRVGGPVKLPNVRTLPANPSSADMRNMIYNTIKALFDGVHPSLFPFDESEHMPWKLLHCNLAKYGLVLEGWDWAIPIPNLLGTRLDRGIGGLNTSELNLLYQQVIKRPLPLSINWSEENDAETQQQYISPQGALAIAPVIISNEVRLKDTKHAWHGRRIVLYSNGMTTQLPVRDLRSLTALAEDVSKTTVGRRKKEIVFVDPDSDVSGARADNMDEETTEGGELGEGHEGESAKDASRSRKYKSREIIDNSDVEEEARAPTADLDDRREAVASDDEDDEHIRSKLGAPPLYSDSEDSGDERRSRASRTATPALPIEPSLVQQPERPMRATRASKPALSAAEVAAAAAAAEEREAALNVQTRKEIAFRLTQINEDIELKRSDPHLYKSIGIGVLKEEERQLKRRLKELPPVEDNSGGKDAKRAPKRRSKEVAQAAENASDDEDNEPQPAKKASKKPGSRRVRVPAKAPVS